MRVQPQERILFTDELLEEGGVMGKIREEIAQLHRQAQERANVFSVCRCREVPDSGQKVRIGPDAGG